MMRRRRTLLAATAVLFIMWALALTSMAQKAPTFDEQGFIVRGLGYLRAGNTHMRVGHPLGLNALSAALLVNDPGVALPTDDPSWSESSFHRPAELFLWEIGNDVEHVMFLARLPTIWLALLLAALAGRWAFALTGRRWAGLLALALLAFDPNILASARLATTDLGLAASALAAGFALWWWLKRPSWSRAALAGAAFGLLQNTKFTAGLFVPLFALVILVGLWQMWRGGPDRRALFWRSLLMLLIAYPLAAFFTLWAAYGFQIGTLPADLPSFTQLAGLTLPLSHHLEQLLDIGGRLQVSTPAFLLGQYSDSGWQYYFPVAFLLKTPLPTLILLVWASVLFVRRLRARRALSAPDSAALLIPAVGYFAFALTTDINLGYRHLLPVLPFLYVFTAVHIPRPAWSPALHPLRRLAPAALLTWLFAAALFIYPDFLAFFNALAGGPNGGWRFLVDSNLDWGQDLDDLPAWMAANGVEQVWLSYFGEGRPEYYGVRYVGLDSFPPRLMNPQARPFYPHNPAPGVYAISATTLQSVHFADSDQFAWFRAREPVDKLGYSIFLYDVPARGAPADLLLSGVQLDELSPADFARLGTNDVTPRWFDLAQSLVLPQGEAPLWLAAAPGQVVHPLLGPELPPDLSPGVSGSGYELYRLADTAVTLPNQPLATLELGDGRLHLWRSAVAASDAEGLTVLSVWQQAGEPQPVKLFVHAVAPDGTLIAQWDGLGAAWEGWRSGDLLLQVQRLPWPAEGAAGEYRLVTGAYDPATGTRYAAPGGSDWVEIGAGE